MDGWIMRGMTLGTFVASLFLAFTIGFVACHNVYKMNLDGGIHGFNNIRRDHTSLHK